MKLHKIILSIVTLTASIIACESLPKEEGIAKIYFTGGTNGVAEISPDDVIIDKENKTMTFAFGISRSGLQPAIGFTVNCEITLRCLPTQYPYPKMNIPCLPKMEKWEIPLSLIMKK